MKRNAVATIVVGGLALTLGAVTACGGGIQAGEEPELQVDSNVIELTDMNPNGSRTQPELQVRNNGDGLLEITNIEWLDQPTRVEAHHRGSVSDDQISCSSSADCPDDSVCLTQQQECRDLGFRDLSGEIPSGATFDQGLVITDEDVPVGCPEPTDSDEVPANYCGAIEIETNAQNDGDNVEGGSAVFYLVSDGTSGSMALSETWMEFTFAAWGATQQQQFEIINEADSPLEMHQLHIGSNTDWFEFIPASPDAGRIEDLVVAGNSSETVTVEMTPPAPEDVDDPEETEIEESVSITFDSSSIDAEPGMVIDITSGPGTVPVIGVEPQQLSFANDPVQTLSVYNYGGATLSVRDMDIRPLGDIEDAYSVTHNGQDMLQPDPDNVIVSASDGEEPTVEHFEVELVDPSIESLIGELRIHHNDRIAESPLSVSLLGDADEVAIGEVAPSDISFRSNAGEADVQIRYLVISNDGNSDLVIDEADMNPGPNTDPDAYTLEVTSGEDLEGLEVPAGELRELKLSYDGDTDFDQSLLVELVSNTAGQQSAMQFAVSGQPLSVSQMDITIAPGFPDVAAVGQQTSFTVVDDADIGRVEYANWYLHDRPAGSEAVIDGAGEQTTFVPDIAGDYRISVVIDDGDGREVQEIFEFEAVD